MKVDSEGNISFRQSWLNTAENCAEKARRELIEESDMTTDEAFIGTAAHYGIEKVIDGDCSPADISDAVVECYQTHPDVSQIVYARPRTHQSDLSQCIDLSQRCAKAWVKDLMPLVPLEGARTEVEFDVELFEYRGRKISIKGTCDLVPAGDNALWDWKTSARSYAQKDKQKWAIQPTVYTVADALGGFGREGRNLPATFIYGVMVKRKKDCKGEIVTVQRSEGHAEHLYNTIRTWVDMYEGMTLGSPWPTRSDGNFLCSKTWCPFYDTCRGAHISLDDDLFGYVAK